ncbi:sugar transferase [Sphingorhabdus sp. M41]|uniref:sugar transferase n=1 Tax=Sphingorhabdus sp. M41 TaxID=1806885 RepID=UPI0009EDB0E2|nr:sugar transferase [Sphingorhabdus sp. M41]
MTSNKNNRVIITGASGFVGRQLVPLLVNRGFDLLLVGRQPRNEASGTEQIPYCTYDQLPGLANGYEALIHLATVNNDSDAEASEFRRINVNFLLETAELAQALGVAKFINVTSTHALASTAQDDYSVSKWTGDQQLRNSGIEGVYTIYSPAVYGTELAGKLKRLEMLPAKLRPLALRALTLLKPVVSVERLADSIADIVTSSDVPLQARRIFVSDALANPRGFAAMKRSGDLFFAICVLIFGSWLMLAIAVIVKLSSPGPAIFAQRRVGKDRKIFTCYKFRTMSDGTKESATHEIQSSSVTGVGSFLRAVKLDELPQIFNIFSNDMSLIGPRPCLPIQTELIEERHIRNVYALKPGITGLAQVQDIDMSDPKRLAETDAQYAAERTLVSEIKILISTFIGKGRGDRTSNTSI